MYTVQVRRRLVYFLYSDSGDPYVHCTGKKEACIFSVSRLRGCICTGEEEAACIFSVSRLRGYICTGAEEVGVGERGLE